MRACYIQFLRCLTDDSVNSQAVKRFIPKNILNAYTQKDGDSPALLGAGIALVNLLLAGCSRVYLVALGYYVVQVPEIVQPLRYDLYYAFLELPLQNLHRDVFLLAGPRNTDSNYSSIFPIFSIISA